MLPRHAGRPGTQSKPTRFHRALPAATRAHAASLPMRRQSACRVIETE